MLTATLDRATMRLVVIDHQPLVRDRVIARLRTESGIAVIAAGGTAHDAIELCEKEKPDVLLLDPLLPDAPASDLVALIRITSPDTRIIVLTDTPEHSAIRAALAAGAAGLLMKQPSDLQAPHADSDPSDRRYCTTGVLAAVVGSVTPRERQVTRLVAAGHTNIEIGSQLGLSNNTVKSYLRNVMQKLQARNRAQLVTNARQHGLI